MFAHQWPDTGEVGDVDGDGGFSCVPEHVGSIVYVGQVVDLCKDGGDDLVRC